jgi:predicted glycosyltransferase
MSTIWVDYVAPKDVVYFMNMVKRLKSRGDIVVATTRKFREVNELMKLKNVEAKILGRYGGGTLKGKLVEGAKRIAKLAEYITRFNVDVMISYCSPEAVRVAFGLQIPIINVYDAPHAIKQVLLVSKLVDVHISPKCIPKREWLKLGFKPEQLLFYDAIDPAAWLKNFTPNENIVKNLGLDPEKKIVVVRAEEAFASYLLGKTSDDNPLITPLIKELLAFDDELQIVVLCRYGRQKSSLSKLFRKITITEHVVDSASLISKSVLFIGGGGTMTCEAALLGVPSISFFPGRLYYEEPLMKEKLLYHPKTPDQAKRLIEKILSQSEDYSKMCKKRAKRLLESMEDPTDTLIATIDKFLKK